MRGEKDTTYPTRGTTPARRRRRRGPSELQRRRAAVAERLRSARSHWTGLAVHGLDGYALRELRLRVRELEELLHDLDARILRELTARHQGAA